MVDFLASGSALQTVSIVVAIVASGVVTAMLVPPVMQKMRARGIIGRDWNKNDHTEIPELGGIAMLFGFPIGISIATGILKLFDSFVATPILAAIGVLFIGGMIGIIDDVSNIPQRVKAVVVAFAALPLILAGYGEEIIALPFGHVIDLSIAEDLKLVYWLLIVPIGITGAANAMNMSAGYNGLETGQLAIISISLLIVCLICKGPMESILIFAAILGAALGLNYYNGYPAVTFVGDVGTLSMGAAIGAGVIIGSIELAGIIAIAPAFYEFFATSYYSLMKKTDRKTACANPHIDEDGKIHPPEQARRYTLAYLILSRKPMTEHNLVRTILALYIVSGILAIIISML